MCPRCLATSQNRSERDSNPRYRLTRYTAFPVRRPRPTRRSLLPDCIRDSRSTPARQRAAVSPVPRPGYLPWQLHNASGRTSDMCVLFAFLAFTALLFGLGFALHVLWWIAFIFLIFWLIGLAIRPRGGRWSYW